MMANVFRKARVGINYLFGLLNQRYIVLPHPLKIRFLQSCLPANRPRIFVETGTWKGDTVEKMRHLCDRVISIELDRGCFEAAKRRFSSCPNVEIIFGDCTEEIPKLLPSLDAPTLFWLDGHWSGQGSAKGTEEEPIVAVLSALARRPGQYTVVIDNARTFNGRDGYPHLHEVLQPLTKIDSCYSISIQNDLIVATPSNLVATF
jgi:hypothetical protein